MQGEFETSLMEELNYFLGLQIKQLNEGVFVCQTKYCNKLLKKLGMENEKSIDTLMPTNVKLEKDENGKDVDVKKYKGGIIYVLYLTASMPDIIVACVCALVINRLPRNHI